MPYGIDKSVGGDSPANVAKVERMVKALMGRYDKVTAIKIAKSQLRKTKRRRRGR